MDESPPNLSYPVIGHYSKKFIDNARREIANKIEKEFSIKRNFKTIPNILDKLFKLYDNKFFDGQLAKIMKKKAAKLNLEYNSRMTKTGGCCKKEGNVYTLNISSSIILGTFLNNESSYSSNGLLCYNRLDCLMNVFEHELIHFVVFLTHGHIHKHPIYKSHGLYFMQLAKAYFGHTEYLHSLLSKLGTGGGKVEDFKIGDYGTYVNRNDELITGPIEKLNIKTAEIGNIRVPYSLMRKSTSDEIDKYKLKIKDVIPLQKFRVGDIISFKDRKGNIITNIIDKVNPKTYIVAGFKVPHSLAFQAKKSITQKTNIEKSFEQAIKDNDIKYIERLLNDAKLFNAVLELKPTIIATRLHNLEVLKLLLSNNKIITTNGEELKLAARYQYTDIINYLINNKKYISNMDNRNEIFQSIFETAVEEGALSIVILIIDKMITLNIKPLNMINKAVKLGDEKLVRYLLNYESQDPRTAISKALLTNTSENMIYVLLSDPRTQPSLPSLGKRVNNAILTAFELYNQTNDHGYVRIINLLLADDRVMNENLPSELNKKRLTLLKNKKWSLNRVQLQSDKNIREFMNNDSANIWKLRYDLLILLLNNDELEKNDALIIENLNFKKYFLMSDVQLMKILNDENIDKFDYLTHTAITLLLLYLHLPKHNQVILELLLGMIPIYVGNEIKKIYIK